VPNAPVFTIVTPTWNRAALLTRVHESLAAQTFRDFEWLVVDDGSEDGTRELIRRLATKSKFPIRYEWQRNSGKHVALNRAAKVARGRLSAVIDSDDWYLPTALETFLRAWSSIPRQELDSFSGVSGLCVDPSGSLIGTPFPRDPLDTSAIDLVAMHVLGDKAGCGRVDVMRMFPFPVIEGERLIIEAIVYRRIAKSYQIRCVNEVIKVVDYQPDGLSGKTRATWLENPKTAKLYFRELLNDGGGGANTYGNHLRYALHAGLARRTFSESPSKWWWAATAPLGVGLYVRDWVRRNQ
jgi:glycosyltransferase involved in cell wall biosynthesis